MVKNTGKRENDRKFGSSEFWIIIALLVALLITEGLIFGLVDSTERGDIMALTFGAFGAWIGAGAAYFFGRENLRTATDSMLRMRGRTPTEILTDTKLIDMKPRKLEKTFKQDTTIKEMLDWLENEKERFFAVVVDDQGKFEYAVDEEALYRYTHGSLKKKKDFDSIQKEKVSTVINEYKDTKELRTLVEAAIKMNEEATAFSASEKMEESRVFVTIVVDNNDRPTGYISTADIRKLISSAGQAK